MFSNSRRTRDPPGFSFYKYTNPIHEGSTLIHGLIISHRPCIKIPSNWDWGFNTWIWGWHKHSVYRKHITASTFFLHMWPVTVTQLYHKCKAVGGPGSFRLPNGVEVAAFLVKFPVWLWLIAVSMQTQPPDSMFMPEYGAPTSFSSWVWDSVSCFQKCIIYVPAKNCGV